MSPSSRHCVDWRRIVTQQAGHPACSKTIYDEIHIHRGTETERWMGILICAVSDARAHLILLYLSPIIRTLCLHIFNQLLYAQGVRSKIQNGANNPVQTSLGKDDGSSLATQVGWQCAHRLVPALGHYSSMQADISPHAQVTIIIRSLKLNRLELELLSAHDAVHVAFAFFWPGEERR